MTETPAPRRSTRATSARAGSATPAPSQPARRSRARTPKAAPLPAVPTATSHAYGARGRVSLETQVDVSGGEGGFAEVFSARRAAAVGRDLTNKGVHRAFNRENSEPVSGDELAEAEESEGEHAGHELYEDNQMSGEDGGRRRIANLRDPIPAARPSAIPADTIRISGTASPNAHHRQIRGITTKPHHGEGVINSHADIDSTNGYDPPLGNSDVTQYPSYTDLDTQFDYSGSFAERPFSRATTLDPPPTREEIEAAQPWSLAVLWETLLRWVQMPFVSFARLSPKAKNGLLASVLVLTAALLLCPSTLNAIISGGSAIGGRFVDSLSSFGKHDLSIMHRVENLERDVRRMGKEFRFATQKLEEILPEHMMVRKDAATGEWDLPPNFWTALRERLADEGSAIAWDGFISTNKAKLDEAAGASVSKALSQHQQVIDQRLFIERVEQIASEMASRTTVDMIKAIPAGDKGSNMLYNLALANLARNTDLAIQTVNYFSYGFGAAIDPYLTSPTFEAEKLWLPKRILKQYLSTAPKAHPPSKILQRWDEATDCWCAAESDVQGKAQVGVFMPLPIVPTSITIEHIPARGTIDIGAAPKEFEVWVTNTEMPFISDIARIDEHGCGEQPGKNYVCIGKGSYSIHGPNHIQNFALGASDLVGSVNKAVVKVKNNWGKSYTCLYRLRMHGEHDESKV
ncbi:hypothetical protein AAFC00_006930 [Neodothiora populina]|uniref:SUN domain-containing protein n=1 Tax=Neodothiora populina TaxID=2781224 RepID=A0ABR3PCX8_9PEZI